MYVANTFFVTFGLVPVFHYYKQHCNEYLCVQIFV